jgi:multidrug efflux pump subunit AcrB
MMASYFLSRTLVPTMMHFLLGGDSALPGREAQREREEKRNWIWRWHKKFDRQFEKMRTSTRRAGVVPGERGHHAGLFGCWSSLFAAADVLHRQGLLSRTSTPAR